jgi:hypothetical protein
MRLLHVSERRQLHIHLAGHGIKSESLSLHSTGTPADTIIATPSETEN